LAEFNDEKKALEKEKYYIAKHNTFKGIGYNCTEGGDGVSGYKHTSEAIQKMKKAKADKLQGANNPFYGKKHSEKTKSILSEKASKRTMEKNHFYKKQHSDESKEKMRKNHKSKKRFFSFKKAEMIRAMYIESNLSYKDISKIFYVSEATISYVITYAKAYKEDKISSAYCSLLKQNKRLFNFNQAELIRGKIIDKEISIKNLCQELGVSRTTLSILLNFKKGYAIDYSKSRYKHFVKTQTTTSTF